MNQQNGQEQQATGTIENPSTGVPTVKGPELNDRDILNDVLATEKYITDNFNVFAREASHERLHKTAMNILGETHEAARQAYDLMFKKGWYKLTSATRSDLQDTKQQFSSYETQFPYSGSPS